MKESIEMREDNDTATGTGIEMRDSVMDRDKMKVIIMQNSWKIKFCTFEHREEEKLRVERVLKLVENS